MLVHRAIHITLDVDEIGDADHIAATYARGIAKHLNRNGCEGEAATVAVPAYIAEDGQAFLLPLDPEPDREPPCTYPSDLDPLGIYY